MDNYILRIETKDGYAIKVLSDVLKNNVKYGDFVFSDCVSLQAQDNKRHKFFKLKLPSERFLVYKCPWVSNRQKLCVGVNMIHLQKMLKSVKKKDSLCLYIKEAEPSVLYITTNGDNITSIRILKLQKEELKGPDDRDYKDEVSVLSKELQKSLKSLSSTSSKNLDISASGENIKFKCACEGMFASECYFGENKNELKEPKYTQTIEFNDLFQLNKLLGLSPNNIVKMSYGKDLPLRISLQILNLGKLVIYIKSKEIVEEEEKESVTVYEDEDEEEEDEEKEN